MPFISSVSGALGGLIWPLSKASPPTVVIGSVSNFNQNRATFNATVSANGATTTTIKFQISTNSGSTWTDASGGTTISNTSSQSVSVYYNATGLSEGTAYTVRCVATNSVGTTNSGTTSFTTWALQVYERSTSGGTTFTIPTVTPTGGSAVAVSIYDIIMFGGGGGSGGSGGGGGGGYQSEASRSMTGNRSITTSVGAGGDGTVDPATNGGNTTLSGDLTTLTASGGTTSTSSSGGSSGNSNAGGSNAVYDTPNNDPKSIDWSNQGYGGGGGAGQVGSNGSANASTTQGGKGGDGVSITRGGVTRNGGAGGGGGAWAGESGTQTAGANGSNADYGRGGRGGTGLAGDNKTQGTAGYIRFRYYAASALA